MFSNSFLSNSHIVFIFFFFFVHSTFPKYVCFMIIFSLSYLFIYCLYLIEVCSVGFLRSMWCNFDLVLDEGNNPAVIDGSRLTKNVWWFLFHFIDKHILQAEIEKCSRILCSHQLWNSNERFLKNQLHQNNIYSDFYIS